MYKDNKIMVYKFIKKNQLQIAIGIVFAVMLFLNYLTPYIYDDFGFSDADSFADIFVLAYQSYFSWTGRVLAGVFARFFLMFENKIFFNFANAAVYTWLSFVIFRIGQSTNLNKNAGGGALLYLLTASLMWLFIPQYGESVFWLVGSCVYLWCTTIILSFLHMYVKDFYECATCENNKVAKLFYMFAFGLFAGACNENTSGSLILILLIYFVYCAVKKKVKEWHYSGFFGTLIGFIFMLSAPGNFVRSSTFSEYSNESQNIILRLINRFITCTDIINDHYKWLVVLWFVMLVLGFAISRNNKNNILSLVFGFAGFAATYAMVLSPSAPARAFCGAAVLFIAGVICSFFVAAQNADIFKPTASLCAFFIIISALSFFTALPDMLLSKIDNNMRYEYISTQMLRGNDNIIVPELRASHSEYNIQNGSLDYIYRDRSDNTSICNRFTGMNSIIAVPTDEWSILLQYM